MKFLKKANIATDKLDHFFWGALLSFPFILVFGYWGAIFCTIMYALKEIVWDYYLDKGNPEFLDFWYSTVPVILYCILIYLN
jgi:hypothetical protein